MSSQFISLSNSHQIFGKCSCTHIWETLFLCTDPVKQVHGLKVLSHWTCGNQGSAVGLWAATLHAPPHLYLPSSSEPLLPGDQHLGDPWLAGVGKEILAGPYKRATETPGWWNPVMSQELVTDRNVLGQYGLEVACHGGSQS
jgi:hypothetical protein